MYFEIEHINTEAMIKGLSKIITLIYLYSYKWDNFYVDVLSVAKGMLVKQNCY